MARHKAVKGAGASRCAFGAGGGAADRSCKFNHQVEYALRPEIRGQCGQGALDTLRGIDEAQRSEIYELF
ncbi:MAG: hypothetical protein ACKVKF_26430, partial [Rhodobacterales bacterium]